MSKSDIYYLVAFSVFGVSLALIAAATIIALALSKLTVTISDSGDSGRGVGVLRATQDNEDDPALD